MSTELRGGQGGRNPDRAAAHAHPLPGCAQSLTVSPGGKVKPKGPTTCQGPHPPWPATGAGLALCSHHTAFPRNTRKESSAAGGKPGLGGSARPRSWGPAPAPEMPACCSLHVAATAALDIPVKPGERVRGPRSGSGCSKLTGAPTGTPSARPRVYLTSSPVPVFQGGDLAKKLILSSPPRLSQSSQLQPAPSTSPASLRGGLRVTGPGASLSPHAAQRASCWRNPGELVELVSPLPEAPTNLPAVITGRRSGPAWEEDDGLAATAMPGPCHEGLAWKQEGPLESAVLHKPA